MVAPANINTKSRLLLLALGASLWVGAAAAETLVVAATVTPGGFDPDALRPNTQNVVSQVYDTLVAYGKTTDAQGKEQLDFTKVAPRLAESWTVSPDGKTYVFKLKQGVKSPFGNEMTADDVIWGYDKSLDQKRTGLQMIRSSAIDKVEKVSTYEVRFTLTAPSQIFLRAMAYYAPTIFDTKEVKKHATPADPWALDWMQANTAGFGPYHLQSLRQGEQAVFIANPNYHGPKPYYDRVVYREVPSPANRLQLIKTGQAHWVEELTHLQVQDLQNDRRVKVVGSVGTSMASARMNANYKPFDNLKVRQALAYATDYEAINRLVFLGLGTRAKSLVPPDIPTHDAGHWPFETNYDKAKALLTEAGYPNGVDITIEYSNIDWWEEGLALQLQQSFAKAGVRLTPKRITAADMRARSAPNVRDLPFFTFRDYPVVLDPIYKMFIDAHPNGVSDRNAYDSAPFRAAIDEGVLTGDPARREQLSRTAQRHHAEDVSWIYTFYPGHFEAMPTCMQGYVWYPDYHERWADLKCVR